mmetsp:Transcript_13125/g.19821  ORF Transcript_13125/g.19821 Transcript_13125/m.19821 type:complete len:295 (+) Transcript_13125:34-918(+)
MTTSEEPYYKTLGKNVLAGGAAGTIEILCMYPLDVAKTRLQLLKNAVSGARVRATTATVLREIYQSHGAAGLYRGIASPIFAEAPKRASKFAFNEAYKTAFAHKNPDGTSYHTFATLYAAGASAGISEGFINCPFEVVKVRMQAKENIKLYSSTSQALVHTVRNEGIMALYRGLEPQLWRNGVWNGTYFSLIGYVKKTFGDMETKTQTMMRDFASGCIASLAGTTLNTPFDVAKSRMQNTGSPYRSAFSCLIDVYKQEGIGALYKGYLPRVYRLGPGGGIMILAFDFFKSLLND